MWVGRVSLLFLFPHTYLSLCISQPIIRIPAGLAHMGQEQKQSLGNTDVSGCEAFWTFSRRLELSLFQGLLQALSGYAFLYPSPGTCGSLSACKATPSGGRTWGVTSSNYQSSFCSARCLFLAVFFAWAQTAAWKKPNFATEEDFILTHGIGIAHHNEERGVA